MIRISTVTCKGSSLLYVLILSIVILTLVLALLLSYQLTEKQKSEIDSRIKLNQIISEVVSLEGANMKYLSQNSRLIDLYGDGSTLVRTNIYPWGNYQVARIISVNNHKVDKVFLCGNSSSSTDSNSLVIRHFVNEMGIGAQINLRNNILINTLKIVPANIDNQSSAIDTFCKGNLEFSVDVEPLYNRENLLQERNIIFFESSRALNDFKGTLVNSYKSPTLIRYSHEKIVINDSVIGNVVIHSDDSIKVGPNAYLSNCILKGRCIIYSSTKPSSAQLFATDTILITKKACLEYPSTIVLQVKENNKAFRSIRLEDSVKFSGEIYAFDFSKPELCENILIQTAPSSEINGCISTNGYCDIHGKVHGQIDTQGVLFVSSYGAQNNVLHKLHINLNSLSPYFIYGFFYNSKGVNYENRLITWLN